MRSLPRTSSAAAALGLAALAIALGTAPAAGAHVRVPFMRGVNIGAWGPGAYDPAATKPVLRRLRKHLHVDTVTLIVVWTQSDGTATSIAPGSEALPDRNLVAAIRYARSLGLKVVLRPYIDPADGSWRGQLAPSSVTAWFASYRRFILRYASLAKRERVTGLIVGSELTSLGGQDQQWRALVRSVRGRFRGFLSYQANWGDTIGWWDAVDAISFSAYYELTSTLDPPVQDIMNGWTTAQNPDGINWFAQIQATQTTYRLPVMFGEIGYRPVADTTRRPWQIESTPGVPYSAAAQTRAYQAAFQVWYHVPWFAGFNWWYVPAGGSPPRSAPGGDHQPLPASLQTMSGWYARRH